MSATADNPPPDMEQGRGLDALEGFRVLDLTTAAAGPICTMMLGDFGADVIKLEPPGGEHGRRWGSSRFGPEEQFSATFLAYNRNKRSVEIDLKDPAVRPRVEELLRGVDVVVENFKPGVAQRLGLSYDDVRQVQPDVVYCSISGFGQTGPLSRRPGFDMLMQAYTGHLSVTGEEGRPPVRIGHSGVDVLTGAHAAFAIVLGLLHRDRSGEGQYIDTSLYDTGLHLISHFVAEYTGTGQVPVRSGPRFAFLAPYGIFEASDRYFYLGISRDGMWNKFCAAAGWDDLLVDHRFTTNGDRVANQGVLDEVLEPRLARQPASHWLNLAEGLDIPASSIESIDEVVDHQQAKAGT